MSTLLLRLAAPMQSWGTQSRFTVRDTGREPSKSGVIGLLCAALGRPREEPVDDLAALRMGVRVDQEGSMKADYHTAGGTHRRDDPYGVYHLEGKGLSAVVSRRYYLSDADFLVGLEGEDDELLEMLQAAVGEPKWQPYLGRKAFVPGAPVGLPDGFRRGVDLVTALTGYPWPRWGLPVPDPRRRPVALRMVLESTSSLATEARADQPLGAAYRDRRFGLRTLETSLVELGTEVPVREE